MISMPKAFHRQKNLNVCGSPTFNTFEDIKDLQRRKANVTDLTEETEIHFCRIIEFLMKIKGE